MVGSQEGVSNSDLSVADMLGPQWFGLAGISDALIADGYLPTSNVFEHMDLTDIAGDDLHTGTTTMSGQPNLKISAQDIEDFEDLLEWSVAGFHFIEPTRTERFCFDRRCDSPASLSLGIRQTSETSERSPTEQSIEPQISPLQIISSPSPNSLSSPVKSPCSPAKPRRQSGGNRDTANIAKRRAHNVIERRYRDKMNSKFAALDRAICKDGKMSSGPLRKSNILSNAIGYVQELQAENTELRRRVELVKGKPLCVSASDFELSIASPA